MSEKKAMRLELLSLTKAYPGCIANDAVSLQVAPGEIHALLGENGAGKSTLMKMIYGVVKPDSGQMTWNDREVNITGPAHARQLGMGMVFQHFSLFETLTVTENIALYLTPAEYGTLDLLRARILAVGDEYGLAINPDRLVHSLSVGEQQRVEIIRCLLQDIQLLILDEPTAVLTPPEVAQLIEVLKKLAHKGCSILFISHKLHEVNALCDKATILRGGKVTGTCIPRETSPGEMARLMLGDELELQDTMPAGNAGECLLALDKIEVKPRDAFAIHLQDIELQLHAGEILGLAGVAGNGQDELVDLINGELGSDSGSLIFHGKDIGNTSVQERRNMGLGVVPADRIGRGALGNMSLTENNLLTSYINQTGKFGWLNWPAIKARAAEIISTYKVKATGAEASAKSLSGGNLQKFIIGREILQNPNVLVCFHPTWGVDVGAANLIHQELIKLRDKGAAILVISEDLDELYLLADRLGALCGGRLSPLAPKSAVPLAQLGQWMTGNFGTLSTGISTDTAAAEVAHAH
ncbi:MULTISPECIES: ABC transporter ATP-binding protein [Cellvibrio]|uniref:Simple sugar transport system ATP-binding protein n=1 Tax=Cellvibrio fibrivorans TaxID=126350 RepID=A0ABU1UZH8_9GAMM|nr:ABC transporter ATP-binding protein [Cellvibrio fibrivorans]MDR7090594.1 simple sugar transport system ATP-binding protein [Cellvibrio fibrivorans]